MAPEAPLAVLERWEHHGAAWRALHVSDERAIVELCTCTGELVERLESADPGLIEYLRERPSSSAAGPA
jgi:hypothetical protein